MPNDTAAALVLGGGASRRARSELRRRLREVSLSAAAAAEPPARRLRRGDGFNAAIGFNGIESSQFAGNIAKILWPLEVFPPVGGSAYALPIQKRTAADLRHIFDSGGGKLKGLGLLVVVKEEIGEKRRRIGNVEEEFEVGSIDKSGLNCDSDENGKRQE